MPLVLRIDPRILLTFGENAGVFFMAGTPTQKKRGTLPSGVRPLTVKVLFDSNAVYTESPVHILPVKVKEIIARHSGHADVDVEWYIPATVRDERHYRMQKFASDLLPSLGKIEQLLGRKLEVTAATLIEMLPTRIDEQLGEANVHVLSLTNSEVDWERVSLDAGFRRPPFSPGNEKGFRDLLIGETFVQLVERSAKSDSSCTVVLVTNDGLLAEMVAYRAPERKNVRILSDSTALDEFLNTVASQATEEYVDALRQSAAKLFFDDSKSNAGLFYSANIAEEIRSRFAAQLAVVGVPGANRVKQGLVRVGAVTFLSKVRRRIGWSTRVTVELQAIADEDRTVTITMPVVPPRASISGQPEAAFSQMIPSLQTRGAILRPDGTFFSRPVASNQTEITYYGGDPALSYWSTFESPSAQSSVEAFIPVSTVTTQPTREETTQAVRGRIIANGQGEIEVRWHATVRTDLRLVKPAVDTYEYVKTTWNLG